MQYFDFTGSLGHRHCLLDLLLDHSPAVPGVHVCVHRYIYVLGYTLSKDSDLSWVIRKPARQAETKEP